MLVFEATDELQGVRDDDYHWAHVGELVYLPIVDCASPTCGCTRGFAGFESHRSTTTAQVVERPGFTIEDLCRELAASLHEGGWIDAFDPSNDLVSTLAIEIVELAREFGRFGPGPVLEREGDMVTHRLPPGVEAIDAAFVDQLQLLLQSDD